jgi:hypothetical protein
MGRLGASCLRFRGRGWIPRDDIVLAYLFAVCNRLPMALDSAWTECLVYRDEWDDNTMRYS